jgi:hypothetical protein
MDDFLADNLIKDLEDVVLALKNSERCKDPDYAALWLAKVEDVNKRLQALSEEEFNELESKYKEWFNENSNSF